ncbi:hypothetical protein OIE66_20410 [Nonomuraea sp. NBC_01738]|uniref:hypothetical protein n=1 Tax=Nonomuraea sp. NBC_01738 TaxID=2976003 RepID=UPI002E158231|nr:hypothetical protein OIE66_20410 [Nonomuraea sp. NBC_01738]
MIVRAFSAATPPARRDALRALLTTWSGSRLAHPGLRRGVVKIETPVAVASPTGAFFALALTPEYPGLYDGWRRRFIEYGEAPRTGEILDVSPLPEGRVTPGRLAAVVARLRAHGPAPWDPAAVDHLTERTGLDRAAACLLLAGLPGVDSSARDFLGEETRALMGVTAKEAARARDEFEEITESDRRDFYEAAIPDEPWDQQALADGLATAWIARYGRRVPVPDEAMTAVSALSPRTPAGRLLSALAAPELCDDLTTGADTGPAGAPRPERIAPRDLGPLIEDLATVLPWAYAHLPGGHPVRARLAEVLALARLRLADPGLSLKVERDWGEETWVEEAVDLLRSDGYGEMAARAGLLGDGEWEADPRVSTPGLAEIVAGTLGVGLDAGVLYLQLLALLEPTDRHVRTWNAWTPARHQKAVAELLERGVVMAAKRERAGRGVFLPGGWTKAKAPNLPVETWKLALYPLDTPRWLPSRSLPGLFAQAWDLVTRGEGPA